MFLGSRARPVREADNLTAIYKQTRHCGILSISQAYRLPRPVTGIASHFVLLILATSHEAVYCNERRSWHLALK
jgi:hypothetical protein